jgi:hypothetical protein
LTGKAAAGCGKGKECGGAEEDTVDAEEEEEENEFVRSYHNRNGIPTEVASS